MERQLEAYHVTRLLIISLLLAVPACDSNDADAKPADNTKTNERDRDDATKTPLDQSEDSADVDLTAKIRSGLMEDESLSIGAKNVKIITADGLVTLRGPVASDEEKTTIETIARAAATPTRVESQLEVVAN